MRFMLRFPVGDPAKEETAKDWRGMYPRGAVNRAIVALEAVRPDTKENGPIREVVDDALDWLYRARGWNELKEKSDG